MIIDHHVNGEVQMSGAPIEGAVGAVILLHGRGGSAEDILTLACPIELPKLAYLAPQASGNSWYPNSFLAPIASNQPWLSSALGKIDSIAVMLERSGIASDRVAIGGFSQGHVWQLSSWRLAQGATRGYSPLRAVSLGRWAKNWCTEEI